MVDIVDMATRSRMMSGIRGKDTQPELAARRYLHSRGLRYRLNVKELPGKPDLVFPKYSVAVFVHGCFWHRHSGCRYASIPSNNKEFWQAKFESNVQRDKINARKLRALGWRVLVVWECRLDESSLDKLFNNIKYAG